MGKGAGARPSRLGEEFNTSVDEYGAHLSSDGKVLFFTRHDFKGDSIFWVAVSAIDKVKR